jgi:predicted DNA-binding antitoxin AbrB/MazE fold protein
MSDIIDAVFENGVFKPLQKVRFKEHQKVALKIVTHDAWDKRFDRIINKISKKTSHYPSEEIESDISLALNKVRNKKYGR